MPLSVCPSFVRTDSGSALRGRGPAFATACVGKMRCDWNWNMAIRKAAAKAAVRAKSLRLSREGRLDGRRNAIDRIRFLDHRRVVELGRRRVDMAACCNHERN